MYDWFVTLIGAPAGADQVVVTACAACVVLCVCIAVKCCFQAIDYMVGGRKK